MLCYLINSRCPHLLLNGQHHGCPVAPNVQYMWNIDMIVPTNIPGFQNGRVRGKNYILNIILLFFNNSNFIFIFFPITQLRFSMVRMF